MGADMKIITASEIKAGLQLAEADGFLWDVAEVVKDTPGTITVRLCSDYSSFESHWTVKADGTPGGIVKTFRKASKLFAA